MSGQCFILDLFFEKHLNIKMTSYQFRDSHLKYKTVSHASKLCHGNFYTWKDDLYIEMGSCFFVYVVFEISTYL